jgi:L-threonylcarbamoyladenylate synthase
MKMDILNHTQEISRAIQCVKNGEVIAYPTESVYGLGCDPMNANAVANLLKMKRRDLGKGFILVASDFDQVLPFIEPPPPLNLAQVMASWPGPVTWIFQASAYAPSWITGDHASTIAIRVSAHPIIRALCDNFGKPIISTSANIAGELPARCFDMVQMTFGDHVDMVVRGAVGSLHKPTTIRDVVTGEVLRA